MSRAKKSMTLVAAGTLAAALSACSTPSESPQLAQAHEAYTTATTNPQIASNATLELRDAEKSLSRAEAARQGGDVDEMNHQAYLASTQVQIAQTVAQAKGAQAVVANAGQYRLQARNQQLEQQLRDLQARRTDRGIVMSLGDVLFATGKAELTSGAATRVDRLAQFLRDHPDRTVRIEGYTDSTGSSQTNLQLSENRAGAVRDQLVSMGVDPSRIMAQGYGEAGPVAPNDTDGGRQQNRRVDIVISDPGNVARSNG